MVVNRLQFWKNIHQVVQAVFMQLDARVQQPKPFGIGSNRRPADGTRCGEQLRAIQMIAPAGILRA
ncbi:hypothetical protein C1Y11_28415 [Pseudomonas sp. FW305-20]|nr:hypothetical protein C1Y11_28415 [Pseudomonas sp. FW305-20]PMU19457.1 hypothetical protein C1Y10_09570 [Pseudomonas sp. FW305-122]PMU38572.1 hypothetical protein C1Y12_16350 [Pseudomonas sp. FW305-47B]PMX59445.1 hypothetical protein C1Y13_17830 [Pseudomonas sp. FW305-33]PMX69451.1 hypothetical protein C1X12_07915 [Pseudomonas sp. FW305-60]PNB71396.1 hypothetical protein C1X64_25240 [Pseudomonas sp. GW456-E7]